MRQGSSKSDTLSRYDWTLSKFDDKHVIMSGRMSIMDPASARFALLVLNPFADSLLTCSVAHENTGQPSERELLDFLNKAPIAMHWLSGTGHVLWANETELNILGYTAEVNESGRELWRVNLFHRSISDSRS